MTPAQLRAYSAVVRLGSVRAAAAELGLSDAGVSMHIAALRKELDDPLFTRTGAGLAFTPGGLRLASRAVEILGLQQQTAIEVTEAAHGRRLLRIAASTAFAEHAAPGLIELFSSRADDLSVELSVHPTSQFRDLICSRAVDIAIGPASESLIGADGSIFVDGAMVDKLKIVDFTDKKSLKSFGSSLFVNDDPENTETTAEGFSIKQGYYEASNVDTVKEMVDMISAMRAYEAYTKADQAVDDSLGKLIDTVKL